MKVTVDSKKGLKTILKVFLDKKTVEEKINTRLSELSKTINLKGFRPGKVPVDVIKRQFGKAVYGEVLEKILKETSTKAIDEKKLKIAGQPKLDLKTYGEGKDLNYTLEIDELPKVKLNTLDKINYVDYEIEISEEEAIRKIKEISQNQNNFKDKKDNEVATEGDLVAFDYEASVDGKSFEGGSGKNTQLVLGKNLFIQGFDNQLEGVKKNQKKDVSVKLPENYPKKEYANKNAVFKCKIINVKKNFPVKIDDEFAKNLGAKDLKDLKQLISKQIKNQYKMSLDMMSKEKILDKLEKIHDIELPENLIKQELEIISQGIKKEDLEKNKKDREKIAKKRIKLGLILNEFGEKNNLKVNEDEIKSAIQKQVQSMPGQQKQVLEYYQKNPSALASLRGTIYEEKIINLIKQKSKVVKKNISTKEAEEILKENHEHKHEHHKESKKPKKTPESKKPKKKNRKK
jgi:trigger factor